jgi:hypothetical protein
MEDTIKDFRSRSKRRAAANTLHVLAVESLAPIRENTGKVDQIMNSAIPVIQVVLAIFAVSAGLLRLLTPYARFTTLPFQAWSTEFKPWQVRAIGFLEVCAAVGIIIPLLLGSVTILTPLAAVGLALVMAGAMATHLRREEYVNMAGNLVWLGLALFFAYGTLVGVVV